MHKRVLGVIAVLVISFAVLPIGRILAESLDVSAQVHAPLPPNNEVPIVETPDDNSTQTVQNIFITGQCYVIDPTLIVVLLRDNQTIGTGPCLPNGTFRILVGLVQGRNIIIPKYVTITGQSGGYGQAITLMYYRPGSSADGQSQQSGPKLTFNYDFITYNDTSPTEITYTVKGGVKPYVVTINWGDGTQTTSKTSSNEPQSSKHQYDRVLPPATLTITAIDAAGEKVIQSRALFSFKKGLYIPAASPVRATSGITMVQKVWACIAAASILLLLAHHFSHTQFLPIGPARKRKSQKKANKKGTKR